MPIRPDGSPTRVPAEDREPSAWSVIERGPGDWMVIDGVSNSLLEVPPAVGQSLWLRDDLWPLSLASALRAGGAVPPRKPRYRLDLDLLGGRIRLVTGSARMAARMAEDFDGLEPPLRRSADVLVRIGATATWDSAYHAVSGERPGFAIRQRNTAVWRVAPPLLPVLPPVGSAPFAGRFVALHAALFVTGDGAGVLLCGGQGSGKTSSMLWLARTAGCEVATDELAMLDLQSGMLYGVPMPLSVRTDGDAKRRTKVPLARRCSVRTGPIAVTTVVLLEARPDAGGEAAPVAEARERFRGLLPHLRDVGADAVLAVSALSRLSQNAAFWRLAVLPGAPAREGLERGLRRFLEAL